MNERKQGMTTSYFQLGQCAGFGMIYCDACQINNYRQIRLA